jgi:serine/threonine-protein kinase
VSAEGGIPFGSYSLFRRLARGGMAEVFLARQRHLDGYDRRVAVKRILPHLSDSADFVRMFLGEARLAARLTHPNIVHIYDFGKFGDEYFIAMEYVDGVHAGQLIKHAKTEPLPPVFIARIGADAAAALHYAHNFTDADGKPLRLVHRDVSPPNLMVSYDGVVKLVDFGIAKATAVENLTNPGTVKGKYAYMSPEQTTARTLDGRSDVFSLGLVLWELIAGRHIVERGNPVDAMRAIRDGKLPRIETVCKGVPRELAHALDLALETDREDRASALELSQILEAYIKAAPDLATSMQLATWLRARFQPTSGTGAMPSLPEGGPGTRVATSGSSAAQSVITPGGGGHELGDTVIDGGTIVGAKSTLSGELAALGAMEGPTTRRVEAPSRPAEPARVKPATRPPPVPVQRQTPPKGKPVVPVPEDSADLDLDETIARGPAVRQTPPPPARSVVLTRPEDKPTELEGRIIGIAPEAMPTMIAEARPTVVAGEMPARPATPPPIDPMRPSDPTIVAVSPAFGAGPPRGVAAGTAVDQPALPVVDRDRADPTNVDPTSARLDRSQLTMIDRTGGRGRGTPRQRAWLAAIAGGVFAAVILVAVFKLGKCGDGGGASDRAVATAPDAATPVAVVDAAPPPDAVPVTTELRVVTTPPGAVAVVGDRRGQTPISFTLEPGTFEVHIELAEHIPVDRTVELKPGDHRILDLTLDPRPPPIPDEPGHRPVKDKDRDKKLPLPGALTVRTTPYSDVYLGKKLLGQTPFADLPLPPGTHILTFKHPGRKPFTRKVEITSGKTARLNFPLP